MHFDKYFILKRNKNYIFVRVMDESMKKGEKKRTKCIQIRHLLLSKSLLVSASLYTFYETLYDDELQI